MFAALAAEELASYTRATHATDKIVDRHLVVNAVAIHNPNWHEVLRSWIGVALLVIV
jgi:hypothetical protein